MLQRWERDGVWDFDPGEDQWKSRTWEWSEWWEIGSRGVSVMFKARKWSL